MWWWTLLLRRMAEWMTVLFSNASPCASIHSYNKDLYLAFNLQLYDFLHACVHSAFCHLFNTICTYLLFIWSFSCLLFVFSMDFLVCSKWNSVCCIAFLLAYHSFSQVCICEISCDWQQDGLMQWFNVCVVGGSDATTRFPVSISSICRWFFSSSSFSLCRFWQHFGRNRRQRCWRRARIQHWRRWTSWRYSRRHPRRNAGREKRKVFSNVLMNTWVLFLWKKFFSSL